jgi:NAD(P)-dependent dehydrogenase (short-subunit alcohol dehydrogenase family)
MLLENKTAAIFGGGGAIGGAVARTFGTEGATVYLSGRSSASVDAVASGWGAQLGQLGSRRQVGHRGRSGTPLGAVREALRG